MNSAFLRHRAAAQSRAREGNSMGYSPEDCDVCLNAFDNSVQRPRTLPCGHTFCGLCINTLSRGGQITCPSCRARHTVPMGGQFPINYTLESVVKTQRNVQGTAGISGKTRSLLRDQETKIMAAIGTCQNVHSQLNQYEMGLEGWGSTQQILEGKFQKVMDQNRTAKDLVQHEKFRTSIKREEVKEMEKELRAALQTLKTVSTEQEAGTAFLDGTRCVEEAQVNAEECMGVLSDESATVTKEIMDVSSEALDSVQTLEVVFEAVLNKAGPVDRNRQGACTFNPRGHASRARNARPVPKSSLSNRLQGLHVHPQPAAHLKVEDVCSLRQPTRSLLEAGRVFAVHQVKGQWQCASITLSGCSVYLHALQDQTLPAGASTLQMSEVLPFLPPCLVFLELTWPGSAPRQVRIRFSKDSPRARQFVLLCTGQWGPSYVGTKLWAVEDKGRSTERVKGGDYESNNGQGGASLFPGPDEGDYQNTVRAGSVWACGWNDAARSAQFAISTKDRTDRCTWTGVFGEVVHGLDVIAAAARHQNIQEVTVVDCGVVLKE